MTSDLPPAGAATPIADSDFAFAFDDSNFSDRILKIEVVSDSTETKSDGQECTTLADWARNRKRRREDTKRDNAVDSVHPEEHILSGQIPDMEGGVGENQYGEAVAMVEGSPIDTGINLNQLGDEAAHNNDSSWSMGNSTVLNVKTLHICSAILAAKSPFFYKLFSNGMMESEQRHVILRIHASEEAAFMDLLNFMYSNTLTERTPTALLDVLMCADKFEVASCMRYCTRLLRDLPMTRESALLYLDLPSSVLMAEAVQPLTEVAKQFLAGLYKDITKFRDDVINLPLAGIEAVLSNDDLQVASEDVVCEFVLKWARTHYPTLEERHEIISSRLGCLVRYPYMSGRRLRKLLTCNDFDTELVTKFVLEALFFKAEAPHRQRSLAAESANSAQHRFVERAYKYRPVKVVEFGQPHQQCIVYLDLKREECAHLFPAGRMYSQAFNFGSQVFFLSAHCNMDQQSSLHYFGLFVGMQEKGSEEFPIEYEFSARSKPTKDFVSKYKGNYTFTGGKAVGYRNLFSLPWKTFMAEDCPYFINGILHLRAELTYKP